jgi:hypothetical protein
MSRPPSRRRSSMTLRRSKTLAPGPTPADRYAGSPAERGGAAERGLRSRLAGAWAACRSGCHFRFRFQRFQRVAAPFPSAHAGRRRRQINMKKYVNYIKACRGLNRVGAAGRRRAPSAGSCRPTAERRAPVRFPLGPPSGRRYKVEVEVEVEVEAARRQGS